MTIESVDDKNEGIYTLTYKPSWFQRLLGKQPYKDRFIVKFNAKYEGACSTTKVVVRSDGEIMSYLCEETRLINKHLRKF
jgi:hypothetical protein